MAFTEILPENMDINVFSSIGKDWMIVTAGQEAYNSMTASWGGFGFMWEKPCAFAVVRPQRYTYKFMEKNSYYTLCFFGGGFKKELRFFGSHSGRSTNKANKTGLTPVHENGYTYYGEASLVIVCRILYKRDICREGFTDISVADEHYSKKDYHRVYVGEIAKILKKSDS